MHTLSWIFTVDGNSSAVQNEQCSAQWALCGAARRGTARRGAFELHKYCSQTIQNIYMFCVDLRTNSDYFPIQH